MEDKVKLNKISTDEVLETLIEEELENEQDLL